MGSEKFRHDAIQQIVHDVGGHNAVQGQAERFGSAVEFIDLHFRTGAAGHDL